MIKNIKDAFTRKKRSRKSVAIAYLISSVVAVSALTAFMYRDDIASWWQNLNKKEIVYDEADLGEVPDAPDEDVEQEAKEYINDENGITYLKTKVASMGYVVPIPVEMDLSKENKWEVSFEAGKTIVVNKEYNGKYGNIEYGVIKIDPTQSFSSIADLRNQTIGKLSTGMIYHGFNTRYRSILIQDAEKSCVEVDENTMEMRVTQNFSDEKQGGYYSNYQSEYLFTKINDNYFILYTIAPASKMVYAEKVLNLVRDNVYMYDLIDQSEDFFVPNAYSGNKINVGSGNIQIPTNLEVYYGNTYLVNDSASSPLAGTYVTITSLSKNTDNLSDFKENIAINYACMLGNKTNYTTIILDGANIKTTSSEKVASERTIYRVTGEVAYSSNELIEIIPFSNDIQYIGYIINVGPDSVLIAGTHTNANQTYVDQYLKNICNTFATN